MNVAVGEARQKEAALRVDHFCRGAAQSFDLLAIAYRDNLVASNGDRLRPLLLWIDGVDAALVMITSAGGEGASDAVSGGVEKRIKNRDASRSAMPRRGWGSA